MTTMKASDCDVYFKIRINDETVKDFRSNYQTVRPDWPIIINNMEYTTPEPIAKDSTIEIEMYDWDSDKKDDLMGKWTLTKSKIGKPVTLNSGFISNNELGILAKWL